MKTLSKLGSLTVYFNLSSPLMSTTYNFFLQNASLWPHFVMTDLRNAATKDELEKVINWYISKWTVSPVWNCFKTCIGQLKPWVAASCMQIASSGCQSHENYTWVATSRIQIVTEWLPVAGKFPSILFMLHATGDLSGTIRMRLAASQVQFVCDWPPVV